ncbi:hypothetical protein [Yoonia sp. SS1-5]|uniref:Uncharacterized protein n=1 Tax=Yoonia rhodophyticola TaxID=3137370 RepID=A0AAN0MAH5_9RHOB
MSDPMTQVIIYMTGTFVLGLLLGWLIWRFGSAKQQELMNAEIKFWRDNLEQSRQEREGELNQIEALRREKEKLKKRLDAAKS